MPAEAPIPRALTEGNLPGSEPDLGAERPLQGTVYICIGASRPDKSIGGPTAIALAQAGADVFITGGDPSKGKKADRVLEAAIDAGGINSARGTYDVTTDDGRKALLEDVKNRYGQVDGVLYYPAGGLVGDDDTERLAHGTALNVTAPVELAQGFLQEGLIKQGGIFQMAPSIYSWGYPNIEAPDPRYNTVAQTKREGELRMHAMTPDFENAGVRLAYLVGHGIDGTFAMNWMMRSVDDDARNAVLASAIVGGEHKLPTIADMAQATVSIATRAREGALSSVHVEYVGIAEDARIPIEPVFLDEGEVTRRLATMYGPEAQMVDRVNLYGQGRRAIAHFKAEGEPVRQILANDLNVEPLLSASHYSIDATDVAGHFDIETGENGKKLGVLPGVKQLAIGRQTVKQIAQSNSVLYDQKPIDKVKSVSNVTFMNPIGPGDEINTNAEAFADQTTFEVEQVRGDGKPVAQFRLKTEVADESLGTNTGRIIDPEYFIEAAAQTALLAARVRHTEEQDILPLFAGITNVEYLQDVAEGENVTIDVRMNDSSGFSADAVIYRADGTPAQVIEGISGVVGESNRMIRIIQRKLNSSQN